MIWTIWIVSDGHLFEALTWGAPLEKQREMCKWQGRAGRSPPPHTDRGRRRGLAGFFLWREASPGVLSVWVMCGPTPVRRPLCGVPSEGHCCSWVLIMLTPGLASPGEGGKCPVPYASWGPKALWWSAPRAPWLPLAHLRPLWEQRMGTLGVWSMM